MLTAMRAVDNILSGTKHDIWAVNAESVYHEEHVADEQPYRRRARRRRRWSSRSLRERRGGAEARSIRLVLVALVSAALVWPAAASAQTTTSNPFLQGLPQPSVSTQTTTAAPTISTSATAGGGSAFTGNSAVIIAIGAFVVLGGISLFIWRDARKRAPVRQPPPAVARR